MGIVAAGDPTGGVARDWTGSALRSIDVLRLALQDANTDVRLAGERAIVDILESVDRPELHLSMALRNRLTELARSTDDSVRSSRRSSCCDWVIREDRTSFLQALQHPSEKIRQLLVEVVPSQHPILIRALSDPSVVVRLFAAHRLAQRRDRRAIPVLREMLSDAVRRFCLRTWIFVLWVKRSTSHRTLLAP